jgi:hypothetical protein
LQVLQRHCRGFLYEQAVMRMIFSQHDVAQDYSARIRLNTRLPGTYNPTTR